MRTFEEAMPVADEAEPANGNPLAEVSEPTAPPVIEVEPVTAPTPEEIPVAEKEPSLREIGRERLKSFGAFFSGAKEKLKNGATQVGSAIAAAAGRAKNIGIAGLEYAAAAPEAGWRALETGVGVGVIAYEKGREAVAAAREKARQAKESVKQTGKSAIESAMRSLVEAKDATIDFGNKAVYRAAERIARPLDRLREWSLKNRLRYALSLEEKGKLKPEVRVELEKLLNHHLALREVLNK